MLLQSVTILVQSIYINMITIFSERFNINIYVITANVSIYIKKWNCKISNNCIN